MTSSTARTYPCPRCPASALRGIGGIGACVQCGGVFVPSSEAHALADALADMADTAQQVAAHAQRAVRTDALARCPICAQEMARVHIGAASGGVDVDACATDGAFYDKGELIAVQRIFAARASGTVTPTVDNTSASRIDLDSDLDLELARAPTRGTPHVPATHYAQVAPPPSLARGREDDDDDTREVERMRGALREAERRAERDPGRFDTTLARFERLALRNKLRDKQTRMGIGFDLTGPLISADTSAEGLILSELSSFPGEVLAGIVGVLDILSCFGKR